MSNSHKSSSHEQMEAENIIFAMIEQKIQVRVEQNRKKYLADNAFTYIQPDFYSEEDLVIGEIFAHIGKNKPAQNNKIANDVLKMLLLEKVTGKQYRKIIVVCDEDELDKLTGLSALAESIRQFDVEIMYVEIDEELRERILNAQSRQKMTNV